MICYAQVPGLSGGHQILALEQVGATRSTNRSRKRRIYSWVCWVMRRFPAGPSAAVAGNSMPSTQDAAADSAADAAAAHPATHTSSQGHTLILGKAHILMEGGQDTLGTVAAVGMIVPSCLAFFDFIHSSFFASSLSFLIR